jgi:hypothetical protein
MYILYLGILWHWPLKLLFKLSIYSIKGVGGGGKYREMDHSWENFYWSFQIIQIYLKFSHASYDSV